MYLKINTHSKHPLFIYLTSYKKLKVLKTGEDVVVFGKLNDEVAASKVFGDIVSLTKTDKGKYKIVAGVENKRSNEGLTPVNQILEGIDPDYLGFPQPLTDNQKKALHNLAVERSKLLVHSIEVVRNELNHKGIEFHEGSIRSLGVSLFINISRYLP